MTWIRLDEDFANHPKVRKAGPLGIAMQVVALGYCNKYLTDGFVPREVVPSLLNLEGLAMHCWDGELVGGGQDAEWQLIVEDLIDAGLWEKVPGGYRIHDYLEYQPSREQVLTERAQKQEAGRKGGIASTQARGQAHAQAHAQAKSKPVPVPVPVPLNQSLADASDTRAAEKTAGAGVADAPPPQPTPKERTPSPKDTTRRALQEHFTSVTGLPPPQESSKAAGAAWHAPIRNIAEMSGWDRDVGCELITAAVSRLDGEHLTIADPRSIVKTAAAILGERRRGVVSPNGTGGPVHEKQTGYDRSKRSIAKFLEQEGLTDGGQTDSRESRQLPGSGIP